MSAARSTPQEPVYIRESGMELGPFDPDNMYQVEKSEYYKNKNGLKKCESIVLHQEKVFYIELKSTVPNSKKCEKRYLEFLNEIKDKIIGSVKMLAFAQLGNPAYSELGKNLQNCSNRKFLFLLLVPDFPDKYLQGLTDALSKSIKESNFLFWCGKKRCHIRVGNSDTAKKYELLSKHDKLRNESQKERKPR
ncbi:hypothetical protein P0082_05885 [Candidatus Haliotispira prima]|uniref:ERCC4 domain-containing protein n=1 Tax=Candidatus Haliotispira prima TaxID=3034016 RepID=A0ABY8MKP9_9SPIO|nr:hypothetical protein P0082_05885 [Candidatus Haliotispira prima]